MKDGLHLTGGMIVGVVLLAAYLFGWGALQKCFGVEVKSVAPDGVNEITLEVDGQGYVQSAKATTAHVPERYIPQSGEKVVIGDIEYVVVAAADWTRWTNAVARLEAVAERRWRKEHETEAGRRAWHGAATNRVVSADGRSVTWLYRDGYAYTEEATPARTVSPAVRAQSGLPRPQSAPKAAGGTGLPPRLEAKRRALKARPAAKEVNATFGAGGKVLKVEGEE